ncbi:MAG: DNA polymerase III subunit delta [Bacteroidaceae bacterium]|nr:DNA polymerase III subunit delta [Bacteroidaceae bacterium]MBR3372820.1 DNA polymerase III subunit delta [Bacteroidaceae bacterium]MBR3733953.1 DNA polymerase III subunit delta [Bacteroidaceae bacterium]MBR4648827.1 DNA polymerase III subunit delta [Bacteroidaceae bacterium]
MAKEITFEDILKDINARNFKPVYLLMGEEPYFIDRLLDAIVSNALPMEERDFCLTTFYGADTTANAVINTARSFPMGSRMVVVVKNANELKDIEELSVYLQNPQPTTVLVLVNKNGNFDRRKKFVSRASSIGVVFESQKVKESQLSGIIATFFRQKGYTADVKSVSLIADSIGSDLTRLYGEMTKLVNSLTPEVKVITPELVEQHIGISKDFNIYEFQNALIARDSFKAFQIAKYFDDNPKQNPIQAVLPSLFRLFSQLMIAYYSPGKDKNSVAQYLGIQPWQVERNIFPAMRNYSAAKVLSILSVIRDTDEKSKGFGGSKVANGDLLKQLVFFILH